MLARVDPHLLVAVAHFEAVDRPPFERFAELAQRNPRGRGGFGHQIIVPVEAVWREIGEPGGIAGRPVTDRQRAAVGILVVRRCGARPVIAILADAGVVIGPAAGIGRLFEAGDRQLKIGPRLAGNAKMEPLGEIGLAILGDPEAGRMAVDTIDNDVAAVKGGADLNVHRTVIVRPDSPGNPLKSAAASLFAIAPTVAASLPSRAAVSARPSQITDASARRSIATLSSVSTSPPLLPPSEMPTPTPTPLP